MSLNMLMGNGFSDFMSLKFANTIGLNCRMPLKIHLGYFMLLAKYQEAIHLLL